MTSHTSISIIICTCNRAEHLRQTLAAMADVCVPDTMPTELIVIDNASTDETAEVVQQCQLPNMLVRYVHEPRRGQCYARNTGMAEAHGDVFLFTDDDVRPPKNWIEGMCGPIVRGGTDAVAGGVTIPADLYHLAKLYPWFFASTETILSEPFVRMVGANMAFSRNVLKNVPAFDVELGPGALGFHDETLFSRQLLQAGYKIMPLLEVEVQHYFDACRVTRSGYLSIAERMGRSDAYLHHHWLHIDRRWTKFQRIRLCIGLEMRRLLSWRACFLQNKVVEWEIDRVTSSAYMDQFDKERKRTRNYSKQGTQKLIGSH